MAAMAFLKARLSLGAARRPLRQTVRQSVRRLDVMAWSVAAVALAGASVSLTLGPGPGALALVVPGEHSTVEPVEETAVSEPAAALIDPTKFRRPAPADDGRPRVAVIIRGLGLSRALTLKAIDLPPDITLGLSAYSRDAQKSADAARAAGHEVFLDIPVEPSGFPTNDGGPQALLSTLASMENARRLDWSLARFSGYPGLVLSDSSPVLNSKETMAPLFKSPALEGLVWAHGDHPGFEDAPIASAPIDLVIGAGSDARAIDEALARLEGLGRQGGAALALVEASPVMVERLAAWAADLDKHGLLLVPASSLAKDPPKVQPAQHEAAADAHATEPEPHASAEAHASNDHGDGHGRDDSNAHHEAPAEPHHPPADDHHAAPKHASDSKHSSEKAPAPVSDAHDAHH